MSTSLDFGNPVLIVNRWKQRISLGEPMQLKENLATLGITASEVCQNPLAAEIALRALGDGRRFFHHEIRGYIPTPDDLAPEVPVWEHAASTPIWIEGIRKTPKYFSFGPDAVFPPFNPNYRQKWRVHELLHMLCGFFWSPQQTRFEMYLGARLCELLPLAHWYGLDEAFRPRCPKHRGQRPGKEFCMDCERLFGFYWDISDVDSLTEESISHVQYGLRYYQEEMDACLHELETGRTHPIPRILLDSSSDAAGFLEGHWNRMTAWSFGAYIDLFLREEDYASSLDNFLRRIERVKTSILTGGYVLDPVESDRLFQLRLLQDAGKRVLFALEWGSDDAREQCWPRLIMCADMVHDGNWNADDVEQAIDELFTEVAMHDLPEAVLQSLPETGLRGKSSRLGMISEGLYDAFPDSLAQIPRWQSQIVSFSDSEIFWSSGSLWKRFSRWTDWETCRLEAWVKQRPHRDKEARLFASMPGEEGLKDGILRCNHTMRRGRFSVEAMESILGWSTEEELLCIWNNGAPVIFVCSKDVDQTLTMVEQGITEESDLLWELLDLGILVWLPKPRA